jgi:DNA-binding transcriptional LysR family regulator
MNLQELRTFLTIIETGSLVRASEVLNVTQSTVTARLKSLEDELGQTLLVRNKSGATLTAAGVSLRRYADTITNLWQQARQDLALPAGLSSVCNIACETDLWPQLGARFLDTLRSDYPDIGVSVWLGSQHDVTAWMDSGKSDLALTYRAATRPKQGQIELTPDDLILVSTQPDAPIRFNPHYIFVEAGDAFGRDHAVAYADAGTARISFGSATVGLDYLIRQGGSAYVPARMAQPFIDAERLFRLAEAPTFQRPVFVTFDKAARSGRSWFDAVTNDAFGPSLG